MFKYYYCYRAGWHRVQLLKLLASLDLHVLAFDYRGMYNNIYIIVYRNLTLSDTFDTLRPSDPDYFV
jgi:hypothetical protein